MVAAYSYCNINVYSVTLLNIFTELIAPRSPGGFKGSLKVRMGALRLCPEGQDTVT